MNKNGWFSKHILIWAYGRGTPQYDIICILILAFIFLINPSCFNKRHYESAQVLDAVYEPMSDHKTAD